METFLEWARNRFTMVSLMHLTDVDNKTFKEMMFENGPSRDEFIKCFVYKLLLNIDPESENSQKHSNIYLYVFKIIRNLLLCTYIVIGFRFRKNICDIWFIG